jgi:hypothetical protein
MNKQTTSPQLPFTAIEPFLQKEINGQTVEVHREFQAYSGQMSVLRQFIFPLSSVRGLSPCTYQSSLFNLL